MSAQFAPAPAKRFTIDATTACDHCGSEREAGAFMFRTPRGVYCSTTCKMWHEGIRGPDERRDKHSTRGRT